MQSVSFISNFPQASALFCLGSSHQHLGHGTVSFALATIHRVDRRMRMWIPCVSDPSLRHAVRRPGTHERASRPHLMDAARVAVLINKMSISSNRFSYLLWWLNWRVRLQRGMKMHWHFPDQISDSYATSDRKCQGRSTYQWQPQMWVFCGRK